MWYKITKIIGISILIIVLTVLTQVGGLILILYLLFWKWMLKTIGRLATAKRIYKVGIKIGGFLIFYYLYRIRSNFSTAIWTSPITYESFKLTTFKYIHMPTESTLCEARAFECYT